MRNIFFVDSENVGDSWIQLFDYLNDDDCILVFYTDKSPNMSYLLMRKRYSVCTMQMLSH